jgi:hypothetical protein
MEHSMIISRRHLVIGSVAAGTLSSATRAVSQTPNKVSKSAAGYQDTARGNQSCGACLNFLPPSDCKMVAGPVATTGWCRLFQGA